LTSSLALFSGLAAGCSGNVNPQDNEHFGSVTAPLTDTSLFNGNEPHIAVNPINPANIATTPGGQIRVSVDGGRTFLPAQSDPNVCGGDLTVTFDSTGRLFVTYLGCSDGLNNILVSELNPSTGAVLPGFPVNASESAGLSTAPPNTCNPNALKCKCGHDKQWIVADRFPTSPNRDNLYLVWASCIGPTYSRSTDGGITWQRAQSFPDQSFRMLNVAVGADGAVYAAYHQATPGFPGEEVSDGTTGRIVFFRSDDGGQTFGLQRDAIRPGFADMTINLQSECRTSDNCTTNFTGQRRLAGSDNLMLGSLQPFLLPDPTNPNRIAVVASDDPTNTDHGAGFDDTSVVIAISTDRGANWPDVPTRVDSGPATSLQLMPTASMDLNTSCLTVSYYDSRRNLTNTQGNFLLDLVVRTSADGGQTWGPERVLSDTPLDGDLNAPIYNFNQRNNPGFIPTFRIGEYNGVLMARGAVWTGNGMGAQEIKFDLSDADPPVVTPPAPVTVLTCLPSENALGTASAKDVCGLPPLSRPVSNLGTILPLAPQSNTVTWSATDGADNVGQATQQVTVNDKTRPKFSSVPKDVTISTCVNANIGKATATDDCGFVKITSDAPAKFPLGTTVVTWTVNDGAGNFDTATQRVTAILGDSASCCPSGTHVIVGTSGSDNIVGTSGADCILGLGGDDVIDARDGNDFISGGAGRDTIMGSLGNDVIFGGSGADTIDGSEGNDFIDGGGDTNTCAGGTGTNKIANCAVVSGCTAACCSTKNCSL
jgi:hypothetical protein